jgi:glycine/D-amino acid oxidase-like deaminating enzyme
MALTADAVVVGGGIIGASIAYHLTMAGAGRVVLCEQSDQPGLGATVKSAGLVRMHHTDLHNARLAVLSFPVFAEWPQIVGGDCGFRQTGFALLVGPEQLDALHANLDQLAGMGVETALLAPEELRQLQPSASVDGVGAVAYEPRSGYADPVRTAFGLIERAVDKGMCLLMGTRMRALALDPGGDQVRGVVTSLGTVHTGAVVLASGGWAGRLLRQVGLSAPIRTKRISACLLAGPALDACCACIDDTVGAYFRPHGPDQLFIGVPNQHWDLGTDADPPLPSIAEVGQARARVARRIAPVAGATLLDRSSGFDAYTPDEHAIIGPAPGPQGLYLAIGFSGGGFKTAPAVGAAVADELLEGGSRPELAPFRLERFERGEPIEVEHRYRHM